MRPRRICPEKEAMHFIASGQDKDTFQKKFINKEKGYGVFATTNIEPGKFLLEYIGRHISGWEGKALLKEYSDADAAFLYFYSFQGQTFCVDGSKETARLGRFMNGDHISSNCKIKIILDDKKSPHLCAFAITKINAGEEIVYDYGDPNCPWRHDRTDTEHCCHQAPTEMEISEITGSDLMDSSTSNEEESSVCESNTEQQISLCLDMSDEEQHHMTPVRQAFEEVTDDEEEQGQQAEAEEFAEKDVSQGKSPSNMDQSARGSNAQPTDVKVKMSSNTAHKRIYDKKNFCLYCKKPFAKISRHLRQKHSDKAEVAKAFVHRQGSVMRDLLLSKIRNMGNYNHNCSVLSSGKGQIIPKRQAIRNTTATDYLPCMFCFAMYLKTDLSRHHKRCKLQDETDRPSKRRVQASCSLMLPMDMTVSNGLKKILEDMTCGAVTHQVMPDALIISLGERMFLKNGGVGRQRADIGNKMRELAQLVLMAKTIDKDIFYLRDLIDPRKFKTVLKAVQKMTGFDERTNRFSAPLTALKMRHPLVKVTHILQGEAMRQGDKDLKGRTEDFLKLIELEWTTYVSANALKTLKEMELSPDAALRWGH